MAQTIIFILLALCLGAMALWWFLKNRTGSGKPETDSECFVVKPYLQFGNAPELSERESMEVMWLTRDRDARWTVDYRSGNTRWIAADSPCLRTIKLQPHEAFRQFRSCITGLTPGASFDYRIKRNGKVVFEATGMARKHKHQPFSVAVYGDIADGEDGPKAVAYQVWKAKPDFLVFAGDVVYKRGRLRDYFWKFFPVYNAVEADPEIGAPVIRSIPHISAAGNHDMGMMEKWSVPDLDRHPDSMGLFIFWSYPLNGPTGPDSKINVPILRGSESNRAAMKNAAGRRYPTMANFSFDYGDSHWLVLDANGYMDWTDEAMRRWVEEDLEAARGTTWKFVCFHQSSFTLDRKHSKEQRMRLLADLFEKHGVDIVFSGHSHSYERSYPLRFKLKAQDCGNLISTEGLVDGELELDRDFDGVEQTSPDGVIYVVTGGGGAKLLADGDNRMPDSLPVWVDKFVGDQHSFTHLKVEGNVLTVIQTSGDGKELDRFEIRKQQGSAS